MAWFKARKPDGTEGTATLKMTYKEGKKEIAIPIYGCILKNDPNFQRFIQNDIKKSANMKKFQETNYIFYTCDSEFVENICVKTTIYCHCFKNPSQIISHELNYSPFYVVKVQKHIFLLCDCDKFNKNKFLKQYSKELQVPAESLDAVTKKERIYGLIVIKDQPQFIPLKLIGCQSSNVFEVDAKDYKQLQDTGPVLLQDQKTVVGSYIKLTDENRITISVFGHVEEEDSGKNKSEKPEDCKNEQQDCQAQSSLEEPIPGPSGIGVEDSVKPDENGLERTEDRIADEGTNKKDEVVKTTGLSEGDGLGKDQFSATESIMNSLEEDGRKNKLEKPECCKEEKKECQLMQVCLQDPTPGGSGIMEAEDPVRFDDIELGRTEEESIDEETNKDDVPKDEMVETTADNNGKDQFSETDSTRKEFLISLADTTRTDTGYYSFSQSEVNNDENYSPAKPSSTVSVHSTKMKAEGHLTQSYAQDNDRRSLSRCSGSGDMEFEDTTGTFGTAGSSLQQLISDESSFCSGQLDSLGEQLSIESVHSTQKEAEGHLLQSQGDNDRNNLSRCKGSGEMESADTRTNQNFIRELVGHSLQSQGENESMSEEYNYSQSEPSSIALVHSSQQEGEGHSPSMQSHAKDSKRKNLRRYSGSGEMEFELKHATVKKEEKLEHKREEKMLAEKVALPWIYVKEKTEQEHDDESDNPWVLKNINSLLNDGKAVKIKQHKPKIQDKFPSSSDYCHPSVSSSSHQGFVQQGHQQVYNHTQGKDSPKDPAEKDHNSGEILAPYPQQVSNSGPEASRDPFEQIKRSLPDGPDQLKDNLCRGKNKQRYRKYLLHVSKKAVGNWQEIGRQLGIKGNVLKQLSADHSSGGSREQAYQMLVYWMNSDKNPTLKRLLTALIDAELAEVASDISDVLTKEHYKSRGGKPVTEALLNRIIKDIKDVWKFLGRYLGIDENTIHSIAMDNRDNTREQAHQMLIKWKQSNASRATSQVLINALEDVEKTNVASFVQEWEKNLEH